MGLLRLLLALALLLGMGVAIAAFSVSLAVVDRHAHDLPDHSDLATYVPRTGSEMRAADGSVIARRADQRRTFVPIGDIPDLVIQAFVSSEDKNYFRHGGVDYVAMVRAAHSTMTGRIMSGASTITQQVAKNLLVGNERSVERKIREALLAMRMDRDLGKDRILEIYLSEIYLGLGAYGVAEAADTFFGKELSELTLPEAALLAGMPQAPSAYNPHRHPERALARRNYVIRRLAEDGAITAEEARAANASPLVLAERRGREPGEEPDGSWFADGAWGSVADYLSQEPFSTQDVVVHTTLQPDLQAHAIAALRDGVLRADEALGWRGPFAQAALPVDWSALPAPIGSEGFDVAVVESAGAGAELLLRNGGRVTLPADGLSWTGKTRADGLLKSGDAILVDRTGGSVRLVQVPVVEGALVAIDPRNGDVLALVGGFSRERSVFDRATQARRQPGSAFKPVIYLAALEIGYDAMSPLLDASIVLEQGPGLDDWRPSDARGAGGGGLISLRRSLEQSRNMSSVRLLWDLGLADVQDVAGRLGITSERSMSYAVALGAGEVTPMQLALAYATIANGGNALRPRFATRISDRDGKEIGVVPPAFGPQVVDPIAAAQLTSVLRGVTERGTGRAAFEGFGRPLAGKTGTTNGSRDAWFAGYGSDVAVVAWIGRDDNRPLAQGATGGRLAATIVRDFLDRAGDRLLASEAPLPEGIEIVMADPATGRPSTASGAISELVRSQAHGAAFSDTGNPSAPAGSPLAQRFENAFDGAFDDAADGDHPDGFGDGFERDADGFGDADGEPGYDDGYERDAEGFGDADGETGFDLHEETPAQALDLMGALGRIQAPSVYDVAPFLDPEPLPISPGADPWNNGNAPLQILPPGAR